MTDAEREDRVRHMAEERGFSMVARRDGYVLADQQTGIHVLAMWPGKPPVWGISRVEAYLAGDDWKADAARCTEIVARAEDRGLHPFTRQNQKTGVWLWNLIGEGKQHRAITYSTVKRMLGIDQGGVVMMASDAPELTPEDATLSNARRLLRRIAESARVLADRIKAIST